MAYPLVLLFYHKILKFSSSVVLHILHLKMLLVTNLMESCFLPKIVFHYGTSIHL